MVRIGFVHRPYVGIMRMNGSNDELTGVSRKGSGIGTASGYAKVEFEVLFAGRCRYSGNIREVGPGKLKYNIGAGLLARALRILHKVCDESRPILLYRQYL